MYVAPASTDVALGTAVLTPALTAPWHAVQAWAYVGRACAGAGLIVATMTDAARPVARTATFGLASLFSVVVLIVLAPPRDAGPRVRILRCLS